MSSFLGASGWTIRSERDADGDRIGSLISAAFADAPHAGGNEAAIVERLRQAGALTLSLVAEEGGEVVGHVAFSPVTIDCEKTGWYGLAPVAVRSNRRRHGVGAALIEAGLDRIRGAGAQGCVVLGDPAYYRRFGFESDPALRYGDVPPEYFQALCFYGARAVGTVDYHPAFTER